MLADLVIENLEIDPDTSVKKIIEFRKKYRDELGRFRTQIGDLSGAILIDRPLEAIQQQIRDIYNEQISPSISALTLIIYPEPS